MCCFSGNVSSVGATRIFARGAGADRQYLAYSMHYEAAGDLAMILPLPTPPGAPEDAVRFIDLSGYAEFFTDLERGFPVRLTRAFQGAPQAQSLKVYSVGSFEASFVPRQADFARLDARFRLPERVWGDLPVYRDYGFAVFKLKPGAHEVHPMAFEFPRRDARRLFFPTVHVHHGAVESVAEFDHTLYCQRAGRERDWQISARELAAAAAELPAREFVDVLRAQGLIDADAPAQKLTVRGRLRNEDIWATE
jgi:hypothetical protein